MRNRLSVLYPWHSFILQHEKKKQVYDDKSWRIFKVMMSMFVQMLRSISVYSQVITIQHLQKHIIETNIL